MYIAKDITYAILRYSTKEKFDGMFTNHGSREKNFVFINEIIGLLRNLDL
jgi:hypothetical protein